MKHFLLVDVDSQIPNIALMKLSTYLKQSGTVTIKRLGYKYYPGKKKKTIIDASAYDAVFASTIFDTNKEVLLVKNCLLVYLGGTGVSLSKKLPFDAESLSCDYDLYPDNDCSYGFITRGCVRDCYFCIVPEKEGLIHEDQKLEDIIQHKKVKFLDNNILAYKNHKSIFKQLVDLKVRCQFNQGLDIRLINEENAVLLSQLNYIDSYIFAFDNMKDEEIIETKLSILQEYISKDWKIKFFIYCHPDMNIINDVLYRIKWCSDRKILPYFMRDISCWDSLHNKFYIDLAAYCNQPNIFKKMDFHTFLNKRHLRSIKGNNERIARHLKLNKGIL